MADRPTAILDRLFGWVFTILVISIALNVSFRLLAHVLPWLIACAVLLAGVAIVRARRHGW